MKIKVHFSLIALVSLAGIYPAAAQGTRFFRISGPTAVTISTFRPDGTLIWSNAQPDTNYTIQTVVSLPGKTNWADFIKIPVASGVNTNPLADFNSPYVLSLIPAGSFTMGDTLDSEADAVPVSTTVSALYMDVNLVSYSQWQAVYNWAITNGYSFDNTGSGQATNHPVQTVNWFDTVKWCNARSQRAGLTPVYFADAGLTQVFTNGDAVPFVNWTNTGYRLPTEAEWEKGARGGLIGQRFPNGNTISESMANYDGDTNHYSFDLGPNGFNAAFTNAGQPYTSPVGFFPANGYELSDMDGNVQEWCWDWYGTPYAGGTDPRGPATGQYRVLRGGLWGDVAPFSRCANRFFNFPSSASFVAGFRCARIL